MSDGRTGLVVPMPALEPLVGPHRLAWDPVAAAGAGAHVTVLFPFAPVDLISDAMLDRVRETVAGFAPFPVTFARTARFPDDVLYLAPEDERPFRDLTVALAAAFPDSPPYGGRFAEVIPHLTVAQHPEAPIAAIAEKLGAALPVTTTATVVELWAEDAAGRWATRASFPLA